MTEDDEPTPEPDGPLSERLRASANTFEPRGPAIEKIRSRGRTRRWIRRTGVVTGSLVIVASVLAPLGLLSRLHDGPAGTAPAAPLGTSFVFGSVIDGRYVLSTANGDGSNIRQLPIPIGVAADPSWSPDGSQIVFSGGGRGAQPSDLYLVNGDGSGLNQLTDDPEIVDWDPEWSPDGTMIAFTRDDDSSDRTVQRIATFDLATGSIEVLPFDGYLAGDPSWSPDGSRITFTGNVEGIGNIFVMDADGSDVTRLTDSIHRFSDNAPAWSPDGTTIAFDRTDESSHNVDIYLMGVDGSDPTPVTSDPALEAAPVWSPDGSRIVFVGLIDDPMGDEREAELYSVRPDGSDVVRLTTGAATGFSPNSLAAPSWTAASR